MDTFKITIHAIALRPIGKLDGAEELIQSKFLAEGHDAQDASKDVLQKFKAQYVTLMDFQITFLSVAPYNEDDEEAGYELTASFREQAE